jgi:ABC-2 type transport system ATP-binding protein
MRQRVKLAQALAHDPDLLVLDEPFNGLDPVARHDVMQRLREWLERGRNLILASHVLHEVETVTPQFVLICGGRLLASGSSHEVHQLLTGLPISIQVRCRHREKLASLLVQEELVETLRFEVGGEILHAETRVPLEIYQRLPGWSQTHGLELQGLESSDDSLQSLFDKLFQMHRGEL